jgi:TnpA family transposase
MSDISDLNFNTLYNTANKFIRLETLKNANDAISNMTAMLPIFKHYNISENLIHSSSDGQRFESQVDTINSRYSSKYPGAKKGISAVSLVANHIPINSEIIGANDHESHFLFDILYNNTSDIKPDIHSTDSHGVNNVNFWILHAFGYKFAPRYKNIRGKTDTSLYAFDSLEKYKDFIIKPIKKINESIIISEWKNIEKILASLSLKVTSQNIIIRKLSSYERKNRTKKALWELDNIIRSFYILDYIDDIELRRDVQRSLNRGEAYHALRRAISDANLGKLKSKTEKEQQIWNESSRLIANCIIFYNANLLSEILKTKEKEKDFDAIKLIKKISPAAWRHINLRGKFNFKGKINNVDIMKIINSLKFN